jgi:CO/xanthine dehydrogenase FAD-binding subunit
MNLRLASPEVLLDIGRCEELRYVRRNGAKLDLGAITTQAAVEADADVAAACPLLAEAITFIGHRAIRNRGTVGGSIAHADPAAELPVVLAALEGEVTVTSSKGSRRVGAEQFFQGFLMTAVAPDELVTEVSFPVATDGAGFAFDEFARRPGDFALVSVACRVGGDGVRVVLGGVGPVPVVVGGIEDADRERLPQAAGAAAAEVDPVEDTHGTKDYRRHLARGLTERAVRRALERA